MELKVGKVISKLRKEHRVTQEQLANAIGVSIPAVSKWETGVAYPDITMLPRIARYFKTTVDDLLGYEEGLTQEQSSAILNECNKLFNNGDFENAITMCVKTLKDYPKDYTLKMFIGVLYSIHKNRVIEDEEKYKYMTNQSTQLLADVEGNSSFTDTEKLNVYSVLASLYLMNKQEDRAIEMLDNIPKLEKNSELTKGTIYIQQEKFEEATKVAKEQYSKLINELLQAISILINDSLHREDYEQTIELLNKYQQFLEEVEVPVLQAIAPKMLYIRLYAKQQNKEMVNRIMQELISTVKNFTKTDDTNNWGNLDSVQLQIMVASVKYAVTEYINALETKEVYSFIQEDKQYRALVEELRMSV